MACPARPPCTTFGSHAAWYADMFYVFHGDDDFSRGEELARLASRMGDPQMADLNTTRLEGQTVAWDELLYHCSTIPFMAERRLVIVTGLLTRLTQRNKSAEDTSFLEHLVEYLPDLPPTTRLVFVEHRQLHFVHFRKSDPHEL